MMNPVGLGVALFGLLWVLGFGYAHYRAASKARASETWPTASGKVLSCEVVVEESTDRQEGTTTWYNPVVRYAYSVAGRDLQGSRLRFGNVRSASRKKAEAALASYPAGGTISVRYNPEKPDECVLESRKPGPTYLLMAAIGIFVFALGAYLAVVAA
jgi:hypothetical protein